MSSGDTLLLDRSMYPTVKRMQMAHSLRQLVYNKYTNLVTVIVSEGVSTRSGQHIAMYGKASLVWLTLLPTNDASL